MMPFSRNKTIANIELIQSVRNEVWGWPAFINFLLGGIAAGFYLLSFLMELIQINTIKASEAAAFKLMAPMMVGIGFSVLSIEAGHPMRCYNLLRGIRSSWMSREIFTGSVFILSVTLDAFFPNPLLEIIATISAMGLITSHGFIFYRAKAIISWSVPLIPIHFLTSSLFMGVGFMLILATDGRFSFSASSTVISVVLITLNLSIWLIYLYGYRDAAFQKATEVLRKPGTLMLAVGIGHLIPNGLLLLILLAQISGIDFNFRPLILPVAGFAIISGGVSQRFGIILASNDFRGIMMREPRWQSEIDRCPVKSTSQIELKEHKLPADS